jgi:exopolysaccharide biosynthesis polyprenyl glycosylphosphotransferase
MPMQRGSSDADCSRQPNRTAPATGTWQRAYNKAVLGVDALAIVIAFVIAVGVRSQQVHPSLLVTSLTAVTVVAWLLVLAFEGAYDVRILGLGASEYQRVAQGSFKFFCLVAIAILLLGRTPDRPAMGLVALLGCFLLLVGRNVTRRVIHRHRAANGHTFRVLAMGDRGHVRHFAATLSRHPEAGFVVVGACTTEPIAEPIGRVPVVGPLTRAREAADSLAVDVIAVTSSPSVNHETVRQLGWSLEGSGIRLALAPSLTDVAGPRISIHAVAGLPLIYVDEPRLGWAHRVVKGTVDRVVASLLLVLLIPVLAVAAVAIRSDSPGPAIFKQTRAGRDGQVFRVWKLRTMYVDAERMIEGLATANESDGLLFKMKCDPRVTRVGAFLRRWSLDELPQLVNVVRGEMSLIGPRPLPVPPDSFHGSERRRLLVKPGVTGLWQVSGRSDVKWEEAVRLDLYYVENWSLWLDFVIFCKTFATVLRTKGAY